MASAYSAFLPAGSVAASYTDDEEYSDEYSGESSGDHQKKPIATNNPPSRVHAAHRSASELRLAAVRTDQLEAISSKAVILVDLIGSGVYGDMYRGRWKECDVAVKVLNPAAVGLRYASRSAWLAFLEDANAMGALRHPNLVEVYGIVLPGSMDMVRPQQATQVLHPSPVTSCSQEDEEQPLAMSGRRSSWDFGAGSTPMRSTPCAPGGSPLGIGFVQSATRHVEAARGMQRLPGPVAAPPAIVMELVSGRSLFGAIERKEDSVAGKLTRVIYALDIARAMAYLHSKGITHFDLKSNNILLGWRNRRPTAKVAGYMLSNRKTVLTSYTPGVTMSRGVLPWTAPEVVRSPERVGQKSDVYSFGVIIWEMWALRVPHSDASYRRLVSALINTQEVVRPTLPGEGSAVPMEEPAPGWKCLVERCWAEDPDSRPTFRELVEELRLMAKAVGEAQRAPMPVTKDIEVAAAVEAAALGGGLEVKNTSTASRPIINRQHVAKDIRKEEESE